MRWTQSVQLLLAPTLVSKLKLLNWILLIDWTQIIRENASFRLYNDALKIIKDQPKISPNKTSWKRFLIIFKSTFRKIVSFSAPKTKNHSWYELDPWIFVGRTRHYIIIDFRLGNFLFLAHIPCLLMKIFLILLQWSVQYQIHY